LEHSNFPLSNLPGSNIRHIDQQKMHQLVKSKKPLTPAQVSELIVKHLIFLESGGAGGSWTTLVIDGIVTGIYNFKGTHKGRQAEFEHYQLNRECSLEGQLLSFANCCGLYAPALEAPSVDLSYSLMTDSFLPDANFQGGLLKRADFSRAVLTNVDFRDADLRYADFENCNLSGANFRGARLEGTRFPGAILEKTMI
jgi:uncharacterized protein YjbI with pentapeptide repeats